MRITPQDKCLIRGFGTMTPSARLAQLRSFIQCQYNILAPMPGAYVYSARSNHKCPSQYAQGGLRSLLRRGIAQPAHLVHAVQGPNDGCDDIQSDIVLKELEQGLCTCCQIVADKQRHENDVGQRRHQKDEPIYDPKRGNVLVMVYSQIVFLVER